MADTTIRLPDDRRREQALVRLRDRIDSTAAIIDSHRIRERHQFADLMVQGFARYALDAAESVCVLIESDRVHFGVFPCARAAFEAAQDALYLASTPEYDKEGVSAYVFERFERALTAARFKIGFPARSTEPDDVGFESVRDELVDDAKRLHTREVDLAALLHIEASRWREAFVKKKIPSHWSAKSRRQLADLMVREGLFAEYSARFNALYSAMSGLAHPRLAEHQWVKANANGRPVFILAPIQAIQMVDATAFALQAVTEALDRAKQRP